MVRRKNVPLFVYQRKRGGAAPIIAMGAKAMIPLAKTLGVKALPFVKSGVMKIAPTLVPMVGKKIREKIGKRMGRKISGKSMKKAEQMLINNVQTNLNKKLMSATQKRRMTRALINSL